jgi:glutaredoxin-like protein
LTYFSITNREKNMPLLSESDREAIRGHFNGLENSVTVSLLKAPGKCDTEEILKELSELSNKLEITVNVPEGSEGPLPSLFIGDTGRIIFRGTPSGYEFSSLLTAIIDSGSNAVKLSAETVEFLDQLTENLHIKVFVTPACPHCPPSVVLAYRMAGYSPLVTAEAIEAGEFPDMASAYQVQGVPRTVINETFSTEGSQPEAYLIGALKRHLEVGN